MSSSSSSSSSSQITFLSSRRAIQSSPPAPQVSQLLQTLYATSIDLTTIASSSASSSAQRHWFCPLSDELKNKIAVYLIYFFALKETDESVKWKRELEGVLKGCEGCAKGWAGARRKFAATYINTFPPPSLLKFSAALTTWTLTLLPPMPPSLFHLPPAPLQLLLTDSSVLLHPDLFTRLQSSLENWDGAVIPKVAKSLGTGLVGLLNLPTGVWGRKIRERAGEFGRIHIQACAAHPLSLDEWKVGGFEVIWDELWNSSAPTSTTNDNQSQDPKSLAKDQQPRFSIITLLLSSGALSPPILQHLLNPPRPTSPAKKRKPLLLALIPHISALLPVFAHLVKLFPTRVLWEGVGKEGLEVAMVFWKEVKGGEFVRSVEDAFEDGKGGVLDWLGGFLESVKDLEGALYPTSTSGSLKGKEKAHDPFAASRPTMTIRPEEGTGFSELLARITTFLLEEMQHTRFSLPVRAGVMEAGLSLLKNVFSNLRRGDFHAQHGMDAVLAIHAGTVVGVTFGSGEWVGKSWEGARGEGRGLLGLLLGRDVWGLKEGVRELGSVAVRARGRSKHKIPSGGVEGGWGGVGKVHDVIWEKVYDTLGSGLSGDVEGIIMLLNTQLGISHLAMPDGMAWTVDGMEGEWVGDWSKAVSRVRRGIRSVRRGLGKVIEGFAVSGKLGPFWTAKGTAETVIKLLLSPDPATNECALALLQESYEDVVLRADSLRALFQYHPEEAMDGLIGYLKAWTGDVKVLPTGVEGARWLVRCLTDLVEVFCRGEGGGVLRDQGFLSTSLSGKNAGQTIQSRILVLWDLLTRSLALILEQTPIWAKFYENPEMVAWMTDALIFGRMMVEETRTFERGAWGGGGGLGREGSGLIGESPRGLSGVGRGMIGQLESVLGNIVGWLRLTEIETLHQTFELICLLLRRFARSQIMDGNSSDGLRKSCSELDRFSRRVKGTKTKLDDSQLSELADLLLPFMESVEEDASDDGIEYISSSVRPATEEEEEKRQRRKERERARQKEQEREREKAKKVETPKKDAFKELMRNAEKDKTPKSQPKPFKAAVPSYKIVETLGGGPSSDASSSKSTVKAAPKDVIDIGESDEYDDFDLLSGMTAGELARIERTASTKPPPPKEKPKPRPTPMATAPRPISTLASASKPKYAVPTSHGILGKIRKDVRTTASGGMFGQRKPLSRPPMGDRVIPRPQPIERQSESSDTTTGPDSSSSDEENKGLRGLQRLNDAGLRNQDPMPVPARIKLIRTMPNAANARELQRQSAQRTKQRLKPDVTELHRELLSWDPKNTSATLDRQMRPVPATFKNASEYQDAFMPMFFNEVWAQSRQEFENSTNPDFLTAEISAKYHTDDFIDIETNVIGRTPDRWHIGESDLVLLKSGAEPGNSTQAMVFAKVQGFKRNPKGQTTINLRLLRDTPELQIKKKWIMQRHINLSTATREFSALKAMPFYEDGMVKDILAGRPALPVAVSDDTVDKAMMAYDVNEPQARAIVGAMRSKGFVLIQGPPGTGKTKTISGLAGRFLAERPNAITIERGTAPVTAKLLICAPSNTAIDEVVRRLMGGVSLGLGRRAVPKIVRIGADSSMHPLVKDTSIDSLVEAKLSAIVQGTTDTSSAISKAQQALSAVDKEYQEKDNESRAIVDNEEKRQAVRQALVDISNRRKYLRAELNKAFDAARDMTRKMDAQRRQARDEVLKDADIICSTLAGAGLDSISFLDFETVIIDEAAQAIELSALIPLKYRCTRCIMIGDPNQLPPTVISQNASRMGYDQSLFVRMQRSHPDSINLLSIQYRMHPDISVLPSRIFYSNLLVDGPDMASKTLAPWHGPKSLGTYQFVNVPGQEANGAHHSKTNIAEVGAIIELYRALKGGYGHADSLLGKIGVISMYKGQVTMLKNRFIGAFGIDCLDDIDFGTVDGFQGQEKTIIILSCVRSSPTLTSIGFLSDFRRMNVALTRAKSSLFVFGNAGTLERGDERWKGIVEDARGRGRLLEYNHNTFSEANTAPPTSQPSPSTKPKPSKSPTTATTTAHPKPKPQTPIGPVHRLGSRPPSTTPGPSGGLKPLPPNGLPKKPPPQTPAGNPPRAAPAPVPPVSGVKRPAPVESDAVKEMLKQPVPEKKKIKRISTVPGTSDVKPPAPPTVARGPVVLGPPPSVLPTKKGIVTGFRAEKKKEVVVNPGKRARSVSPDSETTVGSSDSSSEEEGEVKEKEKEKEKEKDRVRTPEKKKLKTGKEGEGEGRVNVNGAGPSKMLPPPTMGGQGHGKKKLDSSGLFIKKKKPSIVARGGLPPGGR